MGWTFTGRMCLGFMNKTGPVWQWYVGESKTMSFLKETQSFSSNVVMFRWHHEKHSCLAFGHEDGSVSVLEIGNLMLLKYFYNIHFFLFSISHFTLLEPVKIDVIKIFLQ